MPFNNLLKEYRIVKVKELKAFDETKAGVKELVDAGIVKVPGISFDLLTSQT